MIRILSIDGGGLRGIIPLKILKEIENRTGRPISESFDLIAGTSTGGILACALTLKNEQGLPLYSLDELGKIYLADGKTIFPKKIINNWFRPRFSSAGLKFVLEKYLKDKRLKDCTKPVLITCYDVRSYQPYYFTGRFINPGSLAYHHSKNFLLTDICRATSAAPTFLPSFFMEYFAEEQNTKHNFIDGGVYVNNPSMAAIAEILANGRDFLYNSDRINPLKLDDIYLLSLGTGMTSKEITESQGKNWGPMSWVRPVIEVMMQGNSQSVHKQVETLLGKRYLRLNISIDKDLNDMADSRKKTSDGLIAAVNKHLLNNAAELERIANFVSDASL